MPIRSSINGASPSVAARTYPALVKGSSGSVWMMTAAKTGVLVHLERQPFSRKTVGVGYATTKLKETGLSPFVGSITLAA